MTLRDLIQVSQLALPHSHYTPTPSTEQRSITLVPRSFPFQLSHPDVAVTGWYRRTGTA